MKESFWLEVENTSNLLTVVAVGVTPKYNHKECTLLCFHHFRMKAGDQAIISIELTEMNGLHTILDYKKNMPHSFYTSFKQNTVVIE